MTDPTPASPVEDRLRQVEMLVAQVRTGQRPVDEYSAEIRALLQNLEEQEQRIRQIEVPAEALEGLKAELGAGFRGIARFREGLERLLAAGQSDGAGLDEGLALVREGNTLLNEAMRLNQAARLDLERLYQDLSKEGA